MRTEAVLAICLTSNLKFFGLLFLDAVQILPLVATPLPVYKVVRRLILIALRRRLAIYSVLKLAC
jgi:hypothetical protein